IQYWERYKRVMYYRMREIEQDLDLWKNRYFEHLHIRKVMKGQGLSTSSENDKARLQRLEQAFPEFPGRTTNFLMRMTAVGLIIVWVGLLLLETVFTFAK